MSADDCIMFFKASSLAAGNLNEVLKAYTLVSGQLINKQKSTLILSENAEEDTRTMVSSIFNILVKQEIGVYLGTDLDFTKKKS